MSMPGVISVGNLGGKVIYSATVPGSSGAQMTEAKRFSKWTFELDGTFTGGQVKIQGTLDPATVAGSASNWFDLPTTQGGVNPLTAVGQTLSYFGPLIAVQAVVLAVATGTVVVRAFAVPS